MMDALNRMENSLRPAAEEPERYIPAVLNEIALQLDRLESIAAELSERLKPILVSIPEKEQPGSVDPVSPGFSDIHNHLRARLFRIETVANKLGQLIHRLDL